MKLTDVCHFMILEVWGIFMIFKAVSFYEFYECAFYEIDKCVLISQILAIYDFDGFSRMCDFMISLNLNRDSFAIDL